MSKTLIKNGTVVTASAEYKADILIEDGKIKEIGKNLAVEAENIYDAKGKYVFPGGVISILILILNSVTLLCKVGIPQVRRL